METSSKNILRIYRTFQILKPEKAANIGRDFFRLIYFWDTVRATYCKMQMYSGKVRTIHKSIPSLFDMQTAKERKQEQE